MYYCYCFDKDGKYDTPKTCDNPDDALTYVARKQHQYPRILVTDLLDCTVLEMIDGKVVFPTPKDLAAARAEGQRNACQDRPLTFEQKMDSFLDTLNQSILPTVNYDSLQDSYRTFDKLYAKLTLKQMHDSFVSCFGTDHLTENDGPFVLLPSVIKGENTGELCIALVTVDLSSSGEHWGTDFLTGYGVLRQGSEDSTKEQKEFINQHYIPYDYFYTIGLENDIHVDLNDMPEDVKEMLDFCRCQPEQAQGMEFGGL